MKKPSKKNSKTILTKDVSDEEEEEEELPAQGSVQESEKSERGKRTTPSPDIKKKQESVEKSTLVSKESKPSAETKKSSQGLKSPDEDKMDQVTPKDLNKKDPPTPVDSNKTDKLTPDQLLPIDSFFDFPAPKQPTTKLIKIEDIRDWDKAKLTILHDRLTKEKNSYGADTIAERVCQANIRLVIICAYDRSAWDAKIFNAWMDTGFRTVGCVEFIAWVEHDRQRNRNNPSPAEILLGMIRQLHNNEQSVNDRTVAADTGDKSIQALMIELVWEGARLTEPGTELRKSLIKFAFTGKVEDAKAFFTSMGPSTDLTFALFEDVMSKLKYAPMKSEVGFALNLLIVMHKREMIHNENILNTDVLITANQGPTEAYEEWTKSVKIVGEQPCLKKLQQLTQELLLNQSCENIEQAFTTFRDSGKCEKVDMDFTKGKLGKIMAFRAYIGLRKYLTKAKVADYERLAKEEYGFVSLPTDRSYLGVDTYKKRYALHQELANHCRALLCEKKWKNWDDILESISADVKEETIAKMRENAVKQMLNILGECKPGGKCKIDVQSGKISCTSDTMNEALAHAFANMKKEEAAFYEKLLHEATQLKDTAKVLEYLENELNVVESSREDPFFPLVKYFSLDVDTDLKSIDQYALPFLSF